ncbi:hypothetical protein P43SY_000405 [Pythium insidiosum]|uniref:N(4)-(Beta-N-acetylglucosaminyl)-L-asparaginase n=1 Tax=Pythium insidiosum TaxID=114742 RepID=A0AAD5LWU4_PYTIN|nr:hypothetical protein P43SY_000405 [Pythium insidiosum]
MLALLTVSLSLILLQPVECAAVINTWPFTRATAAGFQAVSKTALDAVAAGCHQCELDQCDFTVGFGGSPDTNGETTLDAMILDGGSMGMGAVARLRRIKAAIHVARAVLEHSAHSILAGDGALEFAKMMGFQEESLETPHSREVFDAWRAHKCQPNYYRNVLGQNTSCPPYAPIVSSTSTVSREQQADAMAQISEVNHDTIGMVALDLEGRMAAGASSNGANHKIAGRVGDAAVPGAGAYVDSRIGGAAATGDGDIMMRFLPSFHAVQDMSTGLHPRLACEHALARIAQFYPTFKGAMVCLNRLGEYGGAAHGWNFSFSVQTSDMKSPEVVRVEPLALE